jgi:putative peptidoglycan lipid II flippase
VVAARGVVNLMGWVDVILAGWLAGGAVTILTNAQTLYMLPIALFGMSVAASELPELSRMRVEAEHILVARVSAALRRTAFFVIPSALGYFFLGDVVVGTLYQTGAFGLADTLATSGVLMAFSLGLSATASSRVLSSAFYALRDTRTPARIAYVRVVVATLTGLGLMFPFDRLGVGRLGLGAVGLALGASLGAWIEYILLRRALGRYLGPHGPGTSPILRMMLAGALASAAGVGMELVLPPAYPALIGLETLLPFGVVYLAFAALLGVGIPLRPTGGE